MQTEAAKLVSGLRAAMQATAARDGIIALKGKYEKAIAVLQKTIIGLPIRLKILNDFYPAGDEHITVYETTGKLVPQGGIPINVQCVVSNIETLLNISDAVSGIPVTHTWVTITGDVPNPITARLPIGMAVSDVLALAGRTDTSGVCIIEGGPMMGKVVDNPDHPITKTTKGFIVLPVHHLLVQRRFQPIKTIIRQAQTACMQCRFCTDLCPRYLLGHHIEPHRIMRSIKYMDLSSQVLRMAFACSECGACEYACIMGLSPRAVNIMVKKELMKSGVKPDHASDQQSPHMLQSERHIPVKRLIARLGLSPYDRHAPLMTSMVSPNRVRIRLKQHVGVPCKATVSVGQQVSAGDEVGAVPNDMLGASIHASIDGTVSTITEEYIEIVSAKER